MILDQYQREGIAFALGTSTAIRCVTAQDVRKAIDILESSARQFSESEDTHAMQGQCERWIDALSPILKVRGTDADAVPAR